MDHSVEQILNKPVFEREDLIVLLNADKKERELIFRKAAEVKKEFVGNKVYFRGLVELSNICSKNCYYCGIRSGNKVVDRYFVSDDEVLEAARYAMDNGYGSMVIQSGERTDKVFVKKVTNMLEKIKALSDGKLGITLSMGEQTEETYRQWYASGAHRYLLRIESSNPDLYYKIHPNDARHSFDYRLNALRLLRKVGYNVGTGVMIGLPFQTIDDLAGDLLFFRDMDIDMAGMGPYIEHKDTPLYQYRNILMPKADRFYLSLKMVAILRIMMKDINIAATTAMQTLDKQGREKALKVGANIIMPNLTPVKYREGYLLYEDKPCINEEASECKNCLEARIHIAGDEIGYGEWGDSKHFAARKQSNN
ncbi:MAG: [FeFe] hydrogenase H-cluster radical SAM maturase HydE [Bacteroidetes bacterium]|nr:[FeFe] hydrogenase H-cluster radical SAM maturase HydE [Bacteroidota bacterium]